MKFCVLQADYSTTNVDYKNYDPPRNLSNLWPQHEFVHVFLNKLTTYQQLKTLSTQGFDCFINLCEGYLDWEVPSIDVIYSLDLLNLPYTGPTALLYDPEKELMKYVAYTEGIATANYIKTKSSQNLNIQEAGLQFPLFVKPAKAGDSLGIDQNAKVNTQAELAEQVQKITAEFGEALIEEYIDGEEYTVLVVATPQLPTKVKVFEPVQYLFPENYNYKTYSLKTSELHTKANVPVKEKDLNQALKTAAEKIFTAFNGSGYARLDFRKSKQDGKLYFLEINFTCSVFYTQGMEGSADYLLALDGTGQAGFLQLIIAEGMYRHQQNQSCYTIKRRASAGYGIVANRAIKTGEVVFKGEERAFRLVTERFVKNNWNAAQQNVFKHYALPASSQVYIIWDNEPHLWAPQNHSCQPNTAYDGLNVKAIQPIAAGEELSLDYGTILNNQIEAFNCLCGTEKCRGVIKGQPQNSITDREILLITQQTN
jgi:D-alanine--D-alanine ligase